MITQFLRRLGYSAFAFFNIVLVLPSLVNAADQIGRVVVLLDATSTMSAPCGTMSRFDVARWCLSDVLDLTPSGTPFSFVVAGNGGHSIETFDAMSPDVRCNVRRKVMRINPTGTTSFASCFADPRMVVPTRPDQKIFVVMITDGQSCQASSASSAVTRWQQDCGRPVQSVVVGPCTESSVVRSLSQFATSCGATFTQCPTAQQLHKPLIEAFQICHGGCNSNHTHSDDACAASYLKLVELQERLARIESDGAMRTQSLTQLNSYVGVAGDGNSLLTQAIFGKFAAHVEGNRDGIVATRASLEEVKEGIRRTARFIGYDAHSESLRSVNDKIQTDTTLIKSTLEANEQWAKTTTDRLNALQAAIDAYAAKSPNSDNDTLIEIKESLSSTEWGAMILAGLAVLFSGTTAAGGTWGLNRMFGLVQRQDRTTADVADVVVGDLSRHAAEHNAQITRLMESLSGLNDRLDERVRRTVAEVVAAQTAELRETNSRDRDAVAHAIEKNETAIRLLLQTSLDSHRERINAAINDCANNIKADMNRLDQTVDATGARSSDQLGKVARRLDKCATSIASAETVVRDRMDGLKEQIDNAAVRNYEASSVATQQIDAIKQSLSSLDLALEQRHSGNADRMEQLYNQIRDELKGSGTTSPPQPMAVMGGTDLTNDLGLLRSELTAKLKRLEKMLRRIRRVARRRKVQPSETPQVSGEAPHDSHDPAADLLRIDSLSREHANRLLEQGIQTLSQLADLDDAAMHLVANAIPFLGVIGLHKLRTRARGILAKERE